MTEICEAVQEEESFVEILEAPTMHNMGKRISAYH